MSVDSVTREDMPHLSAEDASTLRTHVALLFITLAVVLVPNVISYVSASLLVATH